VNKRASLTTQSAAQANYPDVLGMISGGKRLTIDTIQAAVAIQPPSVHAGSPFEVMLVLQNISNGDVDAVLKLLIPEKDAAGQKGRFSTNLTKPIRIGLRGAEVGVVNLPVISTAQAAAGNTHIGVEIQVESKQRGATKIRDANGGGLFSVDDLGEDRQKLINSLQGLVYSNNVAGKSSGNKATLLGSFEILPPTISGLPHELRPNYQTLWTIADHMDEAMLAEKSSPQLAAIQPQLNRSNVFFPLLKALQSYFENAGYRLWAGEAVVIAKLFVMTLEMGVPTGQTGYPRWYAKLARLLTQNPQAASRLDTLVTEQLFYELFYDATMLGFQMLTTVTKQDLGSAEEMNHYATQLVASIRGTGEPLNVLYTYLPLVLAGLIANSRVTMPQEQVRDSINLVATAREKRADEMNDDNKFIFEMADDLIDRALEHFS
jgi:hypothetical protein